MNKHSFVVGSLLLAVPAMLSAREPKPPDPCRELKTDLDNQVNSLHRRLNDELSQCRQDYGKNSDVCRDLKNQQQLALRQMRDQRQAQLDSCNPRLNHVTAGPRQSNSCDNQSYRRNDCYPDEKYPDKPPYKEPPKTPPPQTPPPVAHNPPKHDGGGSGGHRGDSDAGDTRSAGNSGTSHHSSDHNSGSSSSSSGSGSRNKEG